jgi:hypothetical protein
MGQKSERSYILNLHLRKDQPDFCFAILVSFAGIGIFALKWIEQDGQCKGQLSLFSLSQRLFSYFFFSSALRHSSVFFSNI